MKKFVIILAVILVSGFTAFSLTRADKKADAVKMSSDRAAVQSSRAAGTEAMATAD